MLTRCRDDNRDSDYEMENALKKELEATKSALKLQTVRCRHLVAAFTKKLQEKEQELRDSKDLRDRQLSRLLRALLVLESRLKKEQKLIRQQLQEKDLIIRNQEKEIRRFKSDACNRRCLDAERNNGTVVADRRLSVAEFSRATGEQRLDSLCKGLFGAPPAFRCEARGNASDEGVGDGANSAGSCPVARQNNTFRDNPVLESVNQILLRDEEDLLNASQPVSVVLSEKVMFGALEDPTEWYETNGGGGGGVAEDKTPSGAWVINVREEAEKSEGKTTRDAWLAEKSSPGKYQHSEEKTCLEMAKKNLTVVDLEEIDPDESLRNQRASSPAKSTASYEEIVPVDKAESCEPARNLQKPPALPPKPARLLKPCQILRRKHDDPPREHPTSGPPRRSLPEKATPPRPPATPNPAKTNRQAAAGKKQPSTVSCSGGQPTSNTRHRHPEPKAESEPAKSRPKPPEPSAKPKKSQADGHPTASSEPVDSLAASLFARHKKKEEVVGNCGAIKIGSSVSSLIAGLSKETIATELGGESTSGGDDSPHVSQLVRQFEVMGKLGTFDSDRTEDEINDIRKNFEEFKLEDSYADGATEGEESGGRHDGDGAENRNSLNYYAALAAVPPSSPKPPSPGSGSASASALASTSDSDCKVYETFLENTGLSQKSILTPSRMLSNHRSCLKPKDVKHRSRLKAAAAIEKCNPSAANSASTVKYWTEPFL